MLLRCPLTAVMKVRIRLRTTLFAQSSSCSSMTTARDANEVEGVFEKLKRKGAGLIEFYETTSGMKEAQAARLEVRKHEELLRDAQGNRRRQQSDLNKVQAQVNEIHKELDKTQRGDERFLVLLQDQHKLWKTEVALQKEFADLEHQERNAFDMLSKKMRISHELDRETELRTKHWSLMYGMVGLALGMLATSISNYLRNREIGRMVDAAQEIHPMLDQMQTLFRTQQQQMAKFLQEVGATYNVDRSKLAPIAIESADSGDPNEQLRVLTSQMELLSGRMEELKRLIVLDQSLGDPKAVVYVGSEMEALLLKTEKSLETKIKLQTLFNTVAVYSVVVLGTSLLYIFFNR